MVGDILGSLDKALDFDNGWGSRDDNQISYIDGSINHGRITRRGVDENIICCGFAQLALQHGLIRHVYGKRQRGAVFFGLLCQLVAVGCWSGSHTSTGFVPYKARAMHMADVVFDVPPLPLAIVRTVLITSFR